VAHVPDGRHWTDVWPARFFHKFAGKDYQDKRPRERYGRGIESLLVCSTRGLRPQLDQGDTYTIADMAILPG